MACFNALFMFKSLLAFHILFKDLSRGESVSMYV